MKHPAYHLRPNKAVDRLTLIDAVGRFTRPAERKEYTYYGLGGPYLEDFRLFYEFYPEMKMVSIEENKQTFKRQRFHLPCGSLRLKRGQLKSFLANYEARDRKSIFWLDYTGLEYGHIEDFMMLLAKVAAGSLIKITLQADPSDYYGKEKQSQEDKVTEFRRKFEAVLPTPSASPPVKSEDFAWLVQEMLQIASQKALPGAVPHMFQPLASFYYSDGTGMFTLTGAVCLRTRAVAVRRDFADWAFKNLDWGKPKEINVPVLTTKERLHLQHLLPCTTNAGKVLRRALGYLIDKDWRVSEFKLGQYANFHRYSPYFMKAIP